MAAYTYKDVCYSVPSRYEERFEEKHGREFDNDPNYNGDYWVITGEWIEDLESDLEKEKHDNEFNRKLLKEVAKRYQIPCEAINDIADSI